MRAPPPPTLATLSAAQIARLHHSHSASSQTDISSTHPHSLQSDSPHTSSSHPNSPNVQKASPASPPASTNILRIPSLPQYSPPTDSTPDSRSPPLPRRSQTKSAGSAPP